MIKSVWIHGPKSLIVIETLVVAPPPRVRTVVLTIRRLTLADRPVELTIATRLRVLSLLVVSRTIPLEEDTSPETEK